jgi:hypothetical protein
MIVVLEDCETLAVELRTWQELAGRVRALRAIARDRGHG